MFAQSERLSRATFDTYFQSGKRIQSPFLTLVYTPHTERHASVVVGKKVAKKAHERNHIRRRVYGVLYRELVKNDVRGVFIVLTKPAFASLNKKEQREEVQKILSRITLSQ
jgi:ribonuclease P protein component